MQEYGVGIFDSFPTKSALKKALKKGYITVNGNAATSATFINGGELISLSVPEHVNPKKRLIFKLQVLFEDDYLAVIHKPAGILVSGNHFKTITNALIQNLKPSPLDDATQPQPVHRLDFPTTGILLIGKTKRSIRALNKLFEDRAIKKTYYAVTIGSMKAEGLIITDVDGKASESIYKVHQTVASTRFGHLNLVELEPSTGRRHQLRKHLASIGNPILGDKDYGIASLILNGKGLYLHAYSLNFVHPFTKEELYLKDDFPVNFKKIFNILET
ncbi:RluA family pseudouridine synthase [Winogradskyella sp. SM1960]|uniref:RluA family pseudouridine synthase n=1 Tax=Winogradskyella sp. SM1960 TaxID=2865955 RepID=UPI001CD703D9|nr:RluA family pseudouridine synthase [Winogradskyella sp. SM1960]